MITEEYREAAVEVLDILDNTNKVDVQKIPLSFIKFLVNIASTSYKVNFDHSKAMSELDLKDKTQEILGVIYINWWSGEEERKIYKQKIEEIKIKRQKELNEKYNPNNIFEKKNTKTTKENLGLIEYKESFFKTIIKKIKSFFK